MIKRMACAVTIFITLWCPAAGTYTEKGPGPAPAVQVSRGEPRYKTMVLVATAYIETGNRTFTGTWPEAGRTVAVDPKVIPLGTRLYVEGWGWVVAEDTGGAIKGRKIDIYMDSLDQALEFGRKNVVVKIPLEAVVNERNYYH